MPTLTVLLVVVTVLAIVGFLGFFLAVLYLRKARDSGKLLPTIDPRGLHPLDQPTH
jgi:hypothetical protein